MPKQRYISARDIKELCLNVGGEAVEDDSRCCSKTLSNVFTMLVAAKGG